MSSRFAAYRALMGFTCQAPVFALFYLSNGLDYRGLMTLAVVFAAAKLGCDVPAGVFADRFGRKKALLIRVALEAVSVAILFDRHFLISSALAGAACAFSSGAEAAMVYEWNAKEFPKVFGRAASWGFLSTALAALAGGGLAPLSFDLVYALRLAALAAAGAVAAGFEESRRTVSRTALKPALAPPRRLVRIFVYVGLVGAVQVAALQLQQPFLRSAGVPLATLGALYVGFQVVTALGARIAHRVPRALRLIGLASTAGFAIMALPIGLAGILGVLLLKFAHGVSLPTVGKSLSEGADPGSRATALSFRSLFEGAALALVAPALGWAADSVSLPSAFGLAAMFVGPSIVFSEVACVSLDSSASPVSSVSSAA